MSGCSLYVPGILAFCIACASDLVYHAFLCLLSLVTSDLTLEVQHRCIL